MSKANRVATYIRSRRPHFIGAFGRRVNLPVVVTRTVSGSTLIRVADHFGWPKEEYTKVKNSIMREFKIKSEIVPMRRSSRFRGETRYQLRIL